MTIIEEYFSDREVNTGRQPELDVAKGFAILFMVWTHVFDTFSGNYANEPLYQIVDEVLGGPLAAPVFMVSLGVGIRYSRHNDPKSLFKRGLSILGIGILLNLGRYVLPDLINYALTGNDKYLQQLTNFWSVDILQFAGLAFIAIAGVMALRMTNRQIAGLAVISSFAGTLLQGVSTGNYLLDQVAGFIWGTGTQSYFPFLNWFVFPLAGLVIGTALRHLNDKAGLYRRLIPISTVIMAGYGVLTLMFGTMFSSHGSYFHLGVIDALFFIILTIGIFALDYVVLQKFKKFPIDVFSRWSRRINGIYVTHWILIGLWGVVAVSFGFSVSMPLWLGTIMAVVLMILSDFIVGWINQLKTVLAR